MAYLQFAATTWLSAAFNEKKLKPEKAESHACRENETIDDGQQNRSDGLRWKMMNAQFNGTFLSWKIIEATVNLFFFMIHNKQTQMEFIIIPVACLRQID